MHISHLLLQLLIEATIKFFVGENDEGDKIFTCFEFALIDFSRITIFILGSLYNKGKPSIFLLGTHVKGIS